MLWLSVPTALLKLSWRYLSACTKRRCQAACILSAAWTDKDAAQPASLVCVTTAACPFPKGSSTRNTGMLQLGSRAGARTCPFLCTASRCNKLRQHQLRKTCTPGKMSDAVSHSAAPKLHATRKSVHASARILYSRSTERSTQ